LTRLTINGIDVTDYAEGLQGVSVTFVLNESNRTVSYAATATITLYGAGYEAVKPLMTDWSIEYNAVLTVDDLQPLEMTVSGRIITDCGCKAELALQTNTENKIAYERIAREIISQGNFWPWMASNGGAAKVPYCYETNFVSYILLSLYILLRPLIGFIQIVVSLFTDQSFDAFGNFVIGCSKFHFTANINKAIQYRASQASVGYSSSILQNKFPDLHLLDAYGYEGVSKTKTPQPSYDTNYIINYTVPQLLDLMREVFNADYRIIDGILIFERKDWFPANAVKLDYTEVEEYCVELDPEMLYNSIRFDWSGDAMDETAQQVGGRYNGRKDLNPSSWPTLKETRQVSPKFAMSRWVSDGYGDQFIRKFRKSPWVGNSIIHDLVLAKGQTYELRLLDLQPGSGYRKPKYFQVGSDFMYNEKLSFLGIRPNTPTLYSEWFDIDDPYKSKRYFIRELTIKPKDICKAIDLIQAKSMNVYVQTPYGRAVPTEIEYQTETGIFVLKDCTVWP
jgi:hypothetical protein